MCRPRSCLQHPRTGAIVHTESRLTHNWLAKKLINDKVRECLISLYGTVVDLGCRIRPYEVDVIGNADIYIGIDWGHTIHELSADIVANLNQPLPVRSDSVDCVLSFEVLEHLAEPGIMLSESLRILRRGGLMVLSVPFQWWVHEAPWDYQRFTRFGLQYQLDKAGFVDIQISETSGFWAMWILKLNYQLRRLVRGPRPVRGAIRALLIPFWWVGQTVAPILDRYWPEKNETAGYFVVARKP